MKLGKREALKDGRNLQLRSVLKGAVTLPKAFDIDDEYGGHLKVPMFANDVYGCCVIAGRAHQTLRMELKDQGGLIGINDTMVVDEYLRLSGGQDNGLHVLPTFKSWRNEGWKWGTVVLRIKAFAEIKAWDHEVIKAAIYGSAGVGLGFGLPATAEKQFDDGRPWVRLDAGAAANPYSWGGHYVYALAYDKDGLTCLTWGKRQFLTWEFLDTYADEVYSAIDAASPNYKHSAIEGTAVDHFLSTFT